MTFLQSKVEKLQSFLGIEPTTLDLSYQSDAYELSDTVIPSLSYEISC